MMLMVRKSRFGICSLRKGKLKMYITRNSKFRICRLRKCKLRIYRLRFRKGKLIKIRPLLCIHPLLWIRIQYTCVNLSKQKPPT
jgi:hypothetical protein